MDKISLLFVITKLELGGAQKHLISLIRSLDKNRYNLFLITAKEGSLVNDALSLNGLTVYQSRFLERPINIIKDALAFFEIYKVIKKQHIKVVHTHSSKAGIIGRLAARFAGAEVIIHTVHGWSFNDYQPNLSRQVYIWLEKTCAALCDGIIVVSAIDRQRGERHKIGRQDQYQLIHYGINRDEFKLKDERIRNELGLSANDQVVGMISCFKPQKAVQDFVKLASLITKSLPATKFLLIGDGELRAKTEALISRYGLNDRFILTGWRRDIPRLLSAIDVFALTSLWEGMPISVLEAMASGVVVVATDTGGIREIVYEGKTGFLVSPHDMDKMSEKIVMLLQSDQTRRAIAKAAQTSLEGDFTIESMGRQTECLYNIKRR